ncbi:unnamed protein product, partial [marine sediment metagenome]
RAFLAARSTMAQVQAGDSVDAARVSERLIRDMEVFDEAPQSTGIGLEKAMVSSPDLRLARSTDAGLAQPARINTEISIVGVEKNKYLPENGNQAEQWTPLETEVDAARNALGNT